MKCLLNIKGSGSQNRKKKLGYKRVSSGLYWQETFFKRVIMPDEKSFMLKQALTNVLRCQQITLERWKRINEGIAINMEKGVVRKLTAHGGREHSTAFSKPAVISNTYLGYPVSFIKPFQYYQKNSLTTFFIWIKEKICLVFSVNTQSKNTLFLRSPCSEHYHKKSCMYKYCHGNLSQSSWYNYSVISKVIFFYFFSSNGEKTLPPSYIKNVNTYSGAVKNALAALQKH